jgi:hypothetical protein
MDFGACLHEGKEEGRKREAGAASYSNFKILTVSSVAGSACTGSRGSPRSSTSERCKDGKGDSMDMVK